MGAAILVALTLAAARSAAQDSAHTRSAGAVPSYRARVLGVFDAESGQPVAGAEVSDLLTGASATTSRTGTVALSFLPEGGGMVRIRKLGYAMQTLTVAISPADTAPVTVALTPAVQLPRVTTYGKAPPISPNLRGFEERRAHSATGYFIPDSVLRQEEARTLGDVLLSHVPGIVVIQRGRKLLLEPSSRCTDGGAPDIYVDGVRLVHVGAKHPVDDTQKLRAFANPGARTDGSTPATTPMDLSQFNVTDLAGVEYYPDKEMVPLELRVPTKACGALFLWTREK